ncbi:MAG: hypothetical protein JW768_14635 [Chitinispirillaceae bacterium]|nr:hypothetical protein [Chitinispirillaceae bacterium]
MIQRVMVFVSFAVVLAALYWLASQDYNQITAVTSASGRFRIIDGKAYATTASITWWDYYNNGTEQTLRYGTSPDNLTNEINLQPFARRTDITTTIRKAVIR